MWYEVSQPVHWACIHKITQNYVENRMLLERAITTVSKELDDVEGEVDDIKTER